MLRLLITVVLVTGALLVYDHLQELNPGSVTVRIGPSSVFDLSPVSLMLISMALGALIVTVLVSVYETKHMIVNWRSARLRRREEKVETLHREGVQAFLSKRSAEAVDLLQKALTLDPNHIDSLLWLGNIFRTENNHVEAVRLHRKARAADERNIEVMLALAKDLEAAKRFEEAQQVLQDILKIDPTNLTTLIRKRELYIRLEKWNDALELQHRLVKANLSQQEQQEENRLLVGITYEVGRQLLERGHPEKARRYFRGAIKRDKTFLPAYIGLGEILISEGKSRSAAEILEKVYVKTGNIILLHRLEELCLDLGEPGEIIRIYQDAIQRDPHNAVLKFYLGKLFYRLEMIDEAFDLLSTLESPRDEMAQMSDYHKIMANLYLRKQQMEYAVQELKRALGFKKRVVVPYVCGQCQQESSAWSGRCRHCGAWNTYVALPWVDTTKPELRDEGTTATRSIPYQSIASPFETV
jgi:lipopolysaccharide biosynthesis regulator YciM